MLLSRYHTRLRHVRLLDRLSDSFPTIGLYSVTCKLVMVTSRFLAALGAADHSNYSFIQTRSNSGVVHLFTGCLARAPSGGSGGGGGRWPPLPMLLHTRLIMGCHLFPSFLRLPSAASQLATALTVIGRVNGRAGNPSALLSAHCGKMLAAVYLTTAGC
eukprot:COSAG06_NODE_716_length_12859_cov_5.127900_12_plen_159_part_00